MPTRDDKARRFAILLTRRQHSVGCEEHPPEVLDLLWWRGGENGSAEGPVQRYGTLSAERLAVSSSFECRTTINPREVTPVGPPPLGAVYRPPLSPRFVV